MDEPAKRYLKLTLAYDGSQYCGWQVQKNGRSIQAVLEAAWQQITGETLRITASGRTDAGVHAIAQVCSLATDSKLPTENLKMALNSNTPFDITVRQVQAAPDGFHAIRDAIEKTYCYHVQYGRIQDPLRLGSCWFTPGQLNITAMRQAAEAVTGQHDFASFQGANSDRKSTVRTIHRLEIESCEVHGFPAAELRFTANGFLYNMVRNLVGTLVRIGQERETIEWMTWVRDQHDRSVAGQTAPPQGLFLEEVIYPV